MSQQCALVAKKTNGMLGCSVQSMATKAGKFSSPLLCPGVATTGALCRGQGKHPHISKQERGKTTKEKSHMWTQGGGPQGLQITPKVIPQISLLTARSILQAGVTWLSSPARGQQHFQEIRSRGGFSDHRITLLFSKEEITSDAEQSPASSQSKETCAGLQLSHGAPHLQRSSSADAVR